jgi:hypothetical protein
MILHSLVGCPPPEAEEFCFGQSRRIDIQSILNTLYLRSLPLVSLKEGSLVDYCSRIIAIGKSATTYRSTDNGVTWKEYTELTLGSGQQAADGEHIAATVAGEYIWIIAGPRIWRARLNSYGE